MSRQENELVCTGPGFQFRALLKQNRCIDEDKLLSQYRADCLAVTPAEALRKGIRTAAALDGRSVLQLTFRERCIQIEGISENGRASAQAATQLQGPTPPGSYWVRAEELLQGLLRFQGQMELLASKQALVLRNASSLYFLVGTKPQSTEAFRQRADGAKARKESTENAA